MERPVLIRKRRPLVAVLLSLLTPGIGQLYNGETLKAGCILLVTLLVPTALAWVSVKLPGPWLLWGMTASVGLGLSMYVVAAVDAARTARRLAGAYVPRAVNRWYVYAAVWVAMLILSSGATQFLKATTVRAFRIPSGSMQPQVLPGDFVLADLTAYERVPPKVGDVVIFRYPDDRSTFFMKRVAALPGEPAPGAETEMTVPNGHVWVLGDNREHAWDSRHFGPVPLVDVVAKVRQVYFSVGPDGVRWDRIGEVVN